MFTGVYGPTSYGAREFLWDELGAINGLWNDPWCIGGDFNITSSQMNGVGKVESRVQ